jgi:membrane fusion protein (multidrug efflux system)
MKRYYLIAAIVAAIVAGWFLWPKNPAGDMQQMAMKPEVSVVTLKPREVVLTRELPGRTSAVRVAEIRPQVSGIVTRRFFEEGSMVRQGQQLYQIDPAPYQAAYNSARANLVKAEANVRAVQAKSERYAELVKIGGVSKQEFDDVRASLSQGRSDVAIAKAELATAKINLDYTRVMSPISGRIGQSKVTEGALVNASQATAIAVVQQLDQIYVDVSRSGEEMMQLRERYPELKTGGSTGSSSSVRLLVDGKPVGRPGTLKFSDVTVNPTTGTILLRVLFPNPDYTILPGMFVHARIEQWKDGRAILVPQKSVSRNVDGSVSVWVVGSDGAVNPRPITVSEIVGDNWLVTGGLKEGEKVVYEGVMKIRPGLKVTAVEAVQPAVSPK